MAERSPRGKHTNAPRRGQRFGRWKCLGPIEYRQTKDRVRPFVLCRCDCGTERWVNIRNLRGGISTSCGCLQRERASRANLTHGQTGERLYRIWKQMHQRCENPNSSAYPWYGGRGIKVCKTWSKFEPFQKWALENGYADDLEIDRINADNKIEQINGGDYKPSNCRWVTKLENLRNR